MSKNIIIFSVVVAICGLSWAEVTNAGRRAGDRKFVSGCGGVYKEGELLVRFAPKPDGKQRSAVEKAQILNSLGGGIEKHRYKLVPGLSLVELAPGRKVETALRGFNNRPEILYAGPNYKLELMADEPPDDPYWKDDYLWGLHNTGQGGGTADADIDAPEAWDIETDAEDIIVAVIDTGIDYDHEDLGPNMWVNEAELNGTPEHDDDENGKEDDIYGWNFYDDNSDITDEWIWDSNGHGSFIAGMIGAVGDNEEGVVGVCWDVQIMNLRIFPEYANWKYDANAVVSGAILAIDYAIENGARVLSNAWGFFVDTEDPNYAWDPCWAEPLKDVIDDAGEAGALLIFAAGNMDRSNDVNQNQIYPQNMDCDNIIVVLNTQNNDVRGQDTCWGANTVDLGAPGMEIWSCDAYGGYSHVSGTSFAQAYVAGAAALVWAVNPDLTYLQVKDILLDTVDELDDLQGKCVSEGRLNVYKALHRASLYPGSGGLCIKSDSGEPVARFTNSGDLFLAGTLTENTTPTATANDEFRVQDSAGDDVAIIDMTNGNMYLAGSVQASWEEPSGESDDFIVKDTSGAAVAYIADSGDLYLKGSVYGPEP